MATIGQQLLQPEAGWKRYDDRNSSIQYYGNIREGSGNEHYNKTLTMLDSYSNKTKFNFKGTKLRLIAEMNYSTSKSLNVIVDGSEEMISSNSGGPIIEQALIYEKLNLDNKIHTVEIIDKSGSPDFKFDAIDIDEDGMLLHPDEVTSLSDLEVGKRIRANYSASYNKFGQFSNLGQETSDFIPPESASIPGGDFYFVMTGYDYLGRNKLVADRNIQHSISWDALNSAGVASGNGLPINLSENDCSVRLLTGGISSSDNDNEWDKIIVESDLNGTITPGDDNVWDWKVNTKSWTSSTPEDRSSYRISRGGYQTIVNYAYSLSSSINSSIGFRPVLLVDSSTSSRNNYIFKDSGQSKTFDIKSLTWKPIKSFSKTKGISSLDNLIQNTTKNIKPVKTASAKTGNTFSKPVNLKAFKKIDSISIL